MHGHFIQQRKWRHKAAWGASPLSGEHPREPVSRLQMTPHSLRMEAAMVEPAQGGFMSAPAGRSKASLGARRNGKDWKGLRTEKTWVPVLALRTGQPVSAVWESATGQTLNYALDIKDGNTVLLLRGSLSSEGASGCQRPWWAQSLIHVRLWWNTGWWSNYLLCLLEQFTYPFWTPVFSPLEWMPILYALLCPSHFKSDHEIHFFPWQLLYLPKKKNLSSSAVGWSWCDQRAGRQQHGLTQASK